MTAADSPWLQGFIQIQKLVCVADTFFAEGKFGLF